MLGSINVLLRRILGTPKVSTVTYTKNNYFKSRVYGKTFKFINLNNLIIYIILTLVKQIIGLMMYVRIAEFQSTS